MSEARVRRFYLASAISTCGDYILYIALAVWVKLLTGSTSQSGLTFLMPILGSLCLPLIGVLIDRVRPKRLLIATYLGTAVLLTALLAVRSEEQVLIVYVVAFCYGISGRMTFGAQRALVARIVRSDLLTDANAVQQITFQVVRLTAPLIGVGLLSWLGAHAVVLVDVGSFLLAAALLHGVRVEDPEPSVPPEGPADDGESGRRRWTSDMAAGFRYVARTAVLRQICLALAVTVFFMGFFETLDLQIATVGLHHEPGWLGLMVSMQGVGGLMGGVVASRLARRLGDGLLTAAGLAAMTVSSLLSAVPDSTVVLAAAVVFGSGLTWMFVGAMTATQKNTPHEMMGRVGGVVDWAIAAPQAVGIAVGAAVIEQVHYRYLCVLAAVGVGAAAIYLATRGEQRRGPGEALPAEVAEVAEVAGSVAPAPTSGAPGTSEER